ncbi:hypothetical protein CFP71_19270 [Amycolatopsis thailandensis]|uniref:Uncharacterized protein n=1 Tax=Amycolatopsis thailandensis TaxID=589330 RepID=A0A229S6T4_9PSEU|nr:hypothetical protein [Amycolatopsis thailandensis]OXM54652.1 hypothetical protein CFP71_19270 [Amycolatopsis thailandensis]
MTVTSPGEQQLVFEAGDATEFRALMGRILDTSPLSCGQISIKTGMPRSTAYSLPDTKRPGLPSNPDQVEAFVKACGLTPIQIDLVKDLWHKLHREAENTRAGSDKPVSAEPAPPAGGLYAAGADFLDGGGYSNTYGYGYGYEQGYGPYLDEEASPLRYLSRAGTIPKPPYARRNTSWTELLHYVLGDERRTRHAVMLLIPVTLLLLGIVCALVFLAVKMPTATPLVVAGLLSPLLIALRRSGRKTKKKIDD